MVRVLIATVVAMLISIVAGPKFIEFLRRRQLGQHIREDMPAGHIAKQGTPTMGGVLILLAASIAFLALSRYSTAALTVFFATVACGAVGFLDDFIKLTHRRSLGLAGRWKLVLLVAITAGVAYLAQRTGHSTSVLLPAVDWEIPLEWAWYGLLFFIIAGAANGVNLTDGIDGLAAGTGIIAVFTFTAIAVFTSVRTGQLGEQSVPYIDMEILGGVFIWVLI